MDKTSTEQRKNVRRKKQQKKRNKEQQKETPIHRRQLPVSPITSQNGLGVTHSSNKGSEVFKCLSSFSIPTSVIVYVNWQ